LHRFAARIVSAKRSTVLDVAAEAKYYVNN
jgi:hypothetical protein